MWNPPAGKRAHPQEGITTDIYRETEDVGQPYIQYLYFRELFAPKQNRNQEHNCTVSVPVAFSLGVFLAWHLHVVEVEVGHHVTHSQHKPVQALVQTPSHSFLWPFPLQQEDRS